MTRATSIVTITAMVKNTMSKLMVQRLIYHSVDIDKMNVFKKGTLKFKLTKTQPAYPKSRNNKHITRINMFHLNITNMHWPNMYRVNIDSSCL